MHSCGCDKSGKGHSHTSKDGIEIAGVGQSNYLENNYLDPKNKNMRKFWEGGLTEK